MGLAAGGFYLYEPYLLQGRCPEIEIKGAGLLVRCSGVSKLRLHYSIECPVGVSIAGHRCSGWLSVFVLDLFVSSYSRASTGFGWVADSPDGPVARRHESRV